MKGVCAFFKKVVLEAFLCVCIGLVCSCDKLKFPGYVVYNVDVSDDVFDLFDVYVTTIDDKGVETVKPLYVPFYSAQFVRKLPAYAEMKIYYLAKSAALHDTLLTRQNYNIWTWTDISTSSIDVEDHTKHVREMGGMTRAGESDAERFVFRVPCTAGEASAVTAEVAPLLYDKQFAFSFRIDGSYVNGWSRMYSLCAGRWIDEQEFLHYDLPKTDGYIPDHKLCITDGCGNDRIFTFGEAIDPSITDEYYPEGIINPWSRNYKNPYITWSELQNITDMGNGLLFHRIDYTTYDENTEYQIVNGLKQDYLRTLEKIGYPLKTLATPLSGGVYLTAGLKSPYVHLISTDKDSETLHLYDNTSLRGRKFYAGATYDTVEDVLMKLETQSRSSDPVLVTMFAHRPEEEYMEMFDYIYTRYGKAGTDKIWVTSLDELYEYKERRRTAEISSYYQDGYKYFEVTVPFESQFVFNELSFIVEGASAPAEYVSTNLYGFSSAVRPDGTVLVNCTFTDRYLKAARRYIDKYEDLGLADDRLDAEYLLTLVRPDLRPSCTSRIGAVTETDMKDYPFEGKYTREQMRKYLRVYDGYSFVVSKNFE